jgi:hypothetical protein
VFGYPHGIVIVGSWTTIFGLYMLDSYIAFILGAPIVGYYACRKVSTTASGCGRWANSGACGAAYWHN